MKLQGKRARVAQSLSSCSLVGVVTLSPWWSVALINILEFWAGYRHSDLQWSPPVWRDGLIAVPLEMHESVAVPYFLCTLTLVWKEAGFLDERAPAVSPRRTRFAVSFLSPREGM